MRTHNTGCRHRRGSENYAVANAKSDTVKYGLFTLFFARKDKYILTKVYSTSTLHTTTPESNRRCLASPGSFQAWLQN